MGYLPEGAPAYSDMTPAQFLDFVAQVRGLDHDQRKEAIATAVKRTDLTSVLEQPIETLSKGFKRRVGLAQAILHDPPVLVMDEPTDGLDPNQKHSVRQLIKTMAPEKATIISTHILEEVEAICTRAVIIDRGRVVADGPIVGRQVTFTVPGKAPGETQSVNVDTTRLDVFFRDLTTPDARANS
jgi:ABC-2 type transport system ATP-binding protein